MQIPATMAIFSHTVTWAFSRILEALAEDLEERDGLDLSEYFIYGTFVGVRRGGLFLSLYTTQRLLLRRGHPC